MVINKREARKEFKSRKTPRGAFAIRCTAAGEVWVGASDHLNSARNGIWFLLRDGLHANKRLQAAWNTYSEEAFDFEVLENVDYDVSPLLLICFVNGRNIE